MISIIIAVPGVLLLSCRLLVPLLHPPSAVSSRRPVLVASSCRCCHPPCQCHHQRMHQPIHAIAIRVQVLRPNVGIALFLRPIDFLYAVPSQGLGRIPSQGLGQMGPMASIQWLGLVLGGMGRLANGCISPMVTSPMVTSPVLAWIHRWQGPKCRIMAGGICRFINGCIRPMVTSPMGVLEGP